ncbi:MAG: CoA transferase [Pseudomonadota bacterium]
MTTALQGLRVVDLSNGPAAGLATMVMADFGAEVIRVVGPEDDPLAQLPSASLWQRGKVPLSLNLTSDQDLQRLQTLLSAADVFVTSKSQLTLGKFDLTYNTLHERYPHLVVCHVTAFGNTGPMAEVPGYEHVIAAYSGRMQAFAGIVDREGPVFSALQVGTHACAQAALAGTLAAVLQRGEAGPGRLVETSLLRGMVPYEQGPMLAGQFPERFGDIYGAPPPPGFNEPPMPSLYYHPAQAGDGRWMQFGNLLPHLFDNFLVETELVDVLADPDYNPTQMLLNGDAHERFRARMLKRIQDKPAAEWMEQFISNGGVVATAYQTTQMALEDPDIVANGHVVERADGGRELGPLARLTATPAKLRQEQSCNVDAWTPRKLGTTQADTTETEARLPLEGIRVVEIATIIAAPLGASFLADMGADVIKIEQIGGDPYRGLAMGVGSGRVNTGKRSISVNMKEDAGRQAVVDLIATADVVIHNFRPGVPEKLGIDYASVSAENPGLVYLQSNGYGPDGPGAPRPSTHPIPGAAMGGVMYQMREDLPRDLQDIDNLRLWTRRLMRANEVNPDPNTAMVVASSVMLGLSARARTGRGQQILIDMFGANAYANHDDFLNFPGKRPRAIADELMHGLSACYRLYPCAEGQWLFIALLSERERTRFAECLAHNQVSAAPSAEELERGDVATVEGLAALFPTRTADEWEAMLTAAHLGCVRADRHPPSRFFIDDEHAQATDMTMPAVHPQWGPYRRHTSVVTFDGTQHALQGPPIAGQHNSEVLAEVGYDTQRIAQMTEDGTLWQEALEP